MGAFIASTKLMSTLTDHPVLGHITTFGGNPVSCAAGSAALTVLQNSGWIEAIKEKENYLITHLHHPAILHRNHAGLWMSLQFESAELTKKIAAACIENGIITDWFLFAEDRIRIAPPLSITIDELMIAIDKIIASIDKAIIK